VPNACVAFTFRPFVPEPARAPLTLWCPPTDPSACSQAVWPHTIWLLLHTHIYQIYIYIYIVYKVPNKVPKWNATLLLHSIQMWRHFLFPFLFWHFLVAFISLSRRAPSFPLTAFHLPFARTLGSASSRGTGPKADWDRRFTSNLVCLLLPATVPVPSLHTRRKNHPESWEIEVKTVMK